jgi:hypothetical protein
VTVAHTHKSSQVQFARVMPFSAEFSMPNMPELYSNLTGDGFFRSVPDLGYFTSLKQLKQAQEMIHPI